MLAVLSFGFRVIPPSWRTLLVIFVMVVFGLHFLIGVKVVFYIYCYSDWSYDNLIWSSFCKLRESSCFGILRESILRINLLIRFKGGWKQFFGPKLGPKVAKLPKIYISRITSRRKLVESGLRYAYPSDNRKFPKNVIFVF